MSQGHKANPANLTMSKMSQMSQRLKGNSENSKASQMSQGMRESPEDLKMPLEPLIGGHRGERVFPPPLIESLTLESKIPVPPAP